MSRTLRFDKDNLDEEEKKSVYSACEELLIIEAFTDKEWHKNLCDKIADKYNESHLLTKKFYMGQAQKWVNMTYKYFWLANILKCDELKLHIPIDSIVIKIALDYGIRPKKMNYNTWSTWTDYEAYITFQEELKSQSKKEKFSSPIRWETFKWIEQNHKDILNNLQ